MNPTDRHSFTSIQDKEKRNKICQNDPIVDRGNTTPGENLVKQHHRYGFIPRHNRKKCHLLIK